MKALALTFLAAAVSLCCARVAAQPMPLPAQDGVYIMNGGQWNRMYLASVSGVRASGGMKTAFSYGIASMKTEVTFRDATAPVATASPRPMLCIVGPSATAPRDIVIVRLEKKKGHRELRVGKANAYTGVQLEYPTKDVTEVTVSESRAGRTIIPKTVLRPGEYILFAGTPTQMPTGYGGYDFSVGTK